jgi:exodeoxyribonuclease V alpha subunit
VFRIGDKVTQIRNNDDKGQAGAFNGTIGVVTALDPDEQTLTVRTDEDESIEYDFDELDSPGMKIPGLPARPRSRRRTGSSA